MFQEYIWQGLILVAVVSGIPLLVSCVVGSVVAILQAATQIQEQSIQFTLRLAAVSAVLFYASGWYLHQVLRFMQELFQSIRFLGNMP